VQSLGSGALLSYQNNQLTQNGNNGSFTATATSTVVTVSSIGRTVACSTD
jgi:hypothetical protein